VLTNGDGQLFLLFILFLWSTCISTGFNHALLIFFFFSILKESLFVFFFFGFLDTLSAHLSSRFRLGLVCVYSEIYGVAVCGFDMLASPVEYPEISCADDT
jgi:hypothetical protein